LAHLVIGLDNTDGFGQDFEGDNNALLVTSNQRGHPMLMTGILPPPPPPP